MKLKFIFFICAASLAAASFGKDDAVVEGVVQLPPPMAEHPLDQRYRTNIDAP